MLLFAYAMIPTIRHRRQRGQELPIRGAYPEGCNHFRERTGAQL